MSELEHANLIPEPKIVCKKDEARYCKEALLQGPYAARAEGHSNKIVLGLIGPYHLIDQAGEWIDQCNGPVESVALKPLEDPRRQRVHKLLFPHFPGCPAVFEKTLVADPRFEGKINLAEMAALDKRNKFAYIDTLLTIYSKKITEVVEAEDRKPDVILVLLTDEMYETCHIVGN